MPEVIFKDLNQIDYKEAWDFQEALFAESLQLKIENRKRPESQQVLPKNYLLFCEHPHVYTLGKSGKENHLLADENMLKAINATYYKINRGGDITYHGPGQLVAYPILDLDQFFTDIHKYLRYLEEAIIKTLADFGIKSGRVEGLTGVWIDGDNPKKARKICAMGVKASRWVTMHGLALNVNANLNYFNYIVPCGIDDKAVTSMHTELGREVDFKKVQQTLKRHLANLFNFNYI
jgi:lipoyl(octanoyl) transferase